ncbi:MAG TPA: heme-binding domain-containing protein [Ignavibacteria bacterium]|nr:heme-binding domain-containing protein [Ignavibacteria bacterium]HAX48118.1 cytochrome C [Bacteroidota bacterium]HRE09195.1 heme-binding domain-containing protein [Ignavibacteria bacterium]HRF66157.1 heme-binding domain-containing protein [Ignavibacteria bacterium]HRJ03467.1 heme-binding domain-containing protein [Ignavibacteria bacterium]
MKKIFKIVLVIIIAGMVAIQFFNRPDMSTTTEITPAHITKVMSVPANVESILKRSCYDCHSDHTTWPWYSSIAPASWLVGDDVVKGKKKMNFSQWGSMQPAKQEARLNEICEEIKSDEMPLPPYLIMHGDAKLSQADKDILCQWVEIELKKLEDANPE